MILYIILAITFVLSPVAYIIGHDLGVKAGRKEGLKAYENNVYQHGSTAYVSIENGRKMAIITLDNDSPLTSKEKLRLVHDVKELVKKEREYEKKSQ